MWDDAGIVRDATSLSRADATLTELLAELATYSLPRQARDRAFNLTWHDWLNLESLVGVSRAIVAAAVARTNSRGAHYRSDFPDPGDLATSSYVQVRWHGGAFACTEVRVRFSRVRPGESLLAC
jgi:fumarate reductase flavoprotein subunit